MRPSQRLLLCIEAISALQMTPSSPVLCRVASPTMCQQHEPATIERGSRAHTLGIALLRRSAFPSDESRPFATLREWWALRSRLPDNLVLVATTKAPWRPWRLLRRKRIIGTVEIHTAGFLRKEANLTEAQAARLQPYLASMAVRSEQRGRGVGRQLVDAAVEALRRGPDRRLLLQVERDNAPAVRLYRSAGFADMAPGAGGPLLCLSLDLKKPRPLPPPAAAPRADWLRGPADATDS